MNRAFAVGLAASASLAVASAPLAAAPTSNNEYKLTVDKQVTVPLGRPGSVSLTIAATARHRISRDGPVVIRVATKPGSGILLRKITYRRRDAADARADNPRFDLRFKTKAAGNFQLAIDVQFWVCARRTCRPVRKHLVANVRVVAAAAPSTDAGADAAN